jgi:hypothetical protein
VPYFRLSTNRAKPSAAPFEIRDLLIQKGLQTFQSALIEENELEIRGERVEIQEATAP